MSPRDIVDRCTRNGTVLWSHVARQLGCSVDAVRARYDQNYLHARIWPHPCEELLPEEPIDENDPHSLRPNVPSMRAEILTLLKRQGSLSVRSIGGRLNRPCNSVRMRLSQLRDSGLVQNDSAALRSGRSEWTWSLTDAGRLMAITPSAEPDRSAA